MQIEVGHDQHSLWASIMLTAFSHFHPFRSGELKEMETQSSGRSVKALMEVGDYGVSTLQKRILQLLMEKGSLSTRAIGWQSGSSTEMVREELLTLQREGLVFVSSWGLVDEDWAITEKGKQKHMQLEREG